MKPTALVLYRGRSLFTGQLIEAVAVNSNGNRKTGAMVGVFIQPAANVAKAVRPHPSVCPDACAFRDAGGCYVNWAWGPRSVQVAHSGRPVCKPAEAREFARDRMVRLGQAGDPAAIPVHVWRKLLTHAAGWTGYTHAWRSRPSLRGLCMASVESHVDAEEAEARGWRAYRVRPRGTDTIYGEIDCPSAVVQCADCGLCTGAGGKAASAPSISIPAHGGAVAARVSDRIAIGV